MRLILPFLALLVPACAPAPTPSPVKQLAQKPTPAEAPAAADDPGALKVARFLGAERVAALTRATVVKSVRLEPWAGGEGVDGDLYGHKITAEGPDLTAAQIDAVRRLLFDSGNYLWDSAKACEFEPGVALRFYGGDPKLKPADVLLCFSCDEWAFHNHGPEVSEDFDPARSTLVTLVKALFPDDPVIQGLK